MDSFTGLTPLITTLTNLVRAVNEVNSTLKLVFPQGDAVTASAGGASGNYLTITGPDGNVYKIQLLNV